MKKKQGTKGLTHELHLKEIFEPTPSGVIKLCTIFNHFDIKSQIEILKDTSFLYPLPGRFHNYLLYAAINSDIPYIRYLAATGLDKNYTPTINNDYLLYINLNQDVNFLEKAEFEAKQYGLMEIDPVVFYKLPHLVRLLLVYSTLNSLGYYINSEYKKFILLINYAIDTKIVTTEEISDLLFEFFCSNNFRNRLKRETYTVCDMSDVYKEIWVLATKLKTDGLSYSIIDRAPVEIGGKPCVSEIMLEIFDDQQLEHLFWREDVGLRSLRKSFFVKSIKGERRRELASACCRNCISDENSILSDFEINNFNEELVEKVFSRYFDEYKRLDQDDHKIPIEDMISKISDELSDVKDKLNILEETSLKKSDFRDYIVLLMIIIIAVHYFK